MVLHLKVWESKTLPGLLASQIFKHDAGWSSPVARQAHNLKVVGSNPTPATNYSIKSISYKILKNFVFGVFLRLKPDNDYRVINKVINVRQVYSPFLNLYR
jgi:hypothetical protein